MTTLMRSRSRLLLAALALVLTVTTLPRIAEAAPNTPLPIDQGQCYVLPPGFDTTPAFVQNTLKSVRCDGQTIESQALESIKIVFGTAVQSAWRDVAYEQDLSAPGAAAYYAAGNTTNPAFAKAVAARARYAATAFLKGDHPLALNVMSSIQNALGTQYAGSMTTSDGWHLQVFTSYAVKYLQYLIANPTP
jgi:hypothetical protein